MNILSIGGSDPSSGAGIQADIKAVSNLGGYCLTVITAITSQNTAKFTSVEAVSASAIKNQLDVILSDFKIDAIKIGMVYNSKIIKAIASKIKKINVPVIIDPVIKSTTGGELLKKESIKDFRKLLIPLAEIITPNVYEVEKLSGLKIKNKNDLEKSAKKIKNFGAKNVVITGYQSERNKISDYVLEEKKGYLISSKKIPSVNHGSGCNYSAALAFYLASGTDIEKAVKSAKSFTINSIKNSIRIGKGIAITETKAKLNFENQLYENISKFTKLKNIFKVIPECQTNYVFAKNKPSSIKSVLGVKGRIVKSGKDVIIAGNLEYGGSRHVASAVVEISKKFPEIRSAINIKYDEKIIKKFKKSKFRIGFYDRRNEPTRIKKKENSSISWGIKMAIKDLKTPPDIIYHKGDFGKEPMILVFGKTPSEVMKKISCIL